MPDEYISREAAVKAANEWVNEACMAPVMRVSRLLDKLAKVPAADVAEVVRCKACAKHYVVNGRDMCARNAQGSGTHWIGLTATSPDAFCSRGERKGEDG